MREQAEAKLRTVEEAGVTAVLVYAGTVGGGVLGEERGFFT